MLPLVHLPCDEPVSRPEKRLIFLCCLRWGGLLALLATEVVALTIRFDTQTAQGGWRWLDQFFDVARVGFNVLVTAVAISLLVLGRRLAEELCRLAERMPEHAWRGYLAAHLTSFVGFIGVTWFLLEGGPRSLPATVALTVCWACLGQATMLAWVACIIPPSDWLPLWHRWSAVFVAGTAVGLAGWIAGQFASRLWESLAVSTLWLVHDLLKQCAEDVVFVPAQRVIGTATFQVEIGRPCSGFEGMGLMLVLIASFLVISRQVLRFPRALWLLPLGCLLSYLGNVVRIVVLIWLGSHVSKDLALGAFHSRAGLLFFLAEGFILIALALRSSLFSAVDRQRGTAGWMASEAYVCPLVALVATTLVTGAFSVGVDPLYPLALIMTCGLLWWNRKSYVDLRWTFTPQSVAIGVAVFALWITLEPRKSVGIVAQGPVGLTEAGLLAWLLARIFGTVLVTPLVEELAFRGYLTRRLMATDFQMVPIGKFSWPSFLISSLLFGFLHERWMAGTLAGLLYSLALYRRRELSDTVLAHAVTYGLIVAYALTSCDWSLWVV